MTKFSNLTVDYRQMLGVTIQDRVQLAKSPIANEIFGNMTPTEIAKLFPTYYQKNIPALAGFAGATTGVGTGFNMGGQRVGAGGDGSSGSNVGSTGQTKAKQQTPQTVAQLIAAAASIKQGGDPGEYGVLGKTVNRSLTPRQRALLDAIGTDSGGGYGTINYVAAQTYGRETQDFSKHPFEGQKGYTAAGRYQMLATNYEKFAKKLGLYNEETKQSDFSPAAQDLVAYEMAKDVYRVGTGGRNLDDDIKNNKVDADSLIRPLSIDYGWHILKTESGMQKAVSVFNENVSFYEQQEIEEAEEQAKKETEGTAEPVVQITPENINTVHGLDPRIIDYANTLEGPEKEKFFNNMNILGNVNEINQKSKSGLDRMNYTPQGTATNVGDAIRMDPIAFWQERNPNGANIEDIDRESLMTAMMAAMKLEADHAAKGTPKRVEFYGPGAGVRDDPSLEGSKHGPNFKEAIDYAIYDVDPETGQKMENQSGAYGNYSNKPNHGGIDGDAFALYHELGQNQELARIHMAANEGNMDYEGWGIRQGGLFSDNSVPWDFMHTDRSAGVDSETGISDHANPGSRGSVADGLSLSAVQELGIDPNSEAGQKLMTGVAERFGDTPDKLAESARKAYAPQPLAAENQPYIQQLPDGQLTDIGLSDLGTTPVPNPELSANTTPVTTETVPVAPPTAEPAAPPPENVPTMSQGGFIPKEDKMAVTNTETGETVAMINDGEVQKGLEPKGAGVEVKSNAKVDAAELSNKYEAEPEDAPPATPEAAQQEVMQQQGKMTSPVNDSQSHKDIGHIPYQSTMDLVHNSLLRAYDIDRRRTGYGNIQ